MNLSVWANSQPLAVLPIKVGWVNPFDFSQDRLRATHRFLKGGFGAVCLDPPYVWTFDTAQLAVRENRVLTVIALDSGFQISIEKLMEQVFSRFAS